MVSIIQGIMLIGGFILLLGSHIFFKSKPAVEQAIDKIVEEVVQTSTSVNLDPLVQTADSVIDEVEVGFEQKDSK
jgi:hypothetical protein